MPNERSAQKNGGEPPAVEEKLDTDLLKNEFDQAWQHYRHVEVARNTFLGFILTIIIGSIGLALTGSTDLLSPNEIMFLGIFFLAFLISLTLVYMAAAVYKLKFVRDHYRHVWDKIRKKCYKKQYTQLNAWLDIYEQEKHRIIRDKEFSHEYMITLLILVFTVGLIAAEISLWIYYLIHLKFGCLYFVIAALLIMVPAYMGIRLLGLYRSYKKREKEENEKPHGAPA